MSGLANTHSTRRPNRRVSRRVQGALAGVAVAVPLTYWALRRGWGSQPSQPEIDFFETSQSEPSSLQALRRAVGELDRRPSDAPLDGLVEACHHATVRALTENHGDRFAELLSELLAFNERPVEEPRLANERPRDSLGVSAVARRFVTALPAAAVAELCRGFLDYLKQTHRPWLSDAEMETVFWFAITRASSSPYHDELLKRVRASAAAIGSETRAASALETLNALTALLPDRKLEPELKEALRKKRARTLIQPRTLIQLRDPRPARGRPSPGTRLTRRALDLVIAPLIDRPSPLLGLLLSRLDPKTMFGVPSIRNFLREGRGSLPGSLTRLDVALTLVEAGMRAAELLTTILRAEPWWGDRRERVLSAVAGWGEPRGRQAPILAKIDERLAAHPW